MYSDNDLETRENLIRYFTRYLGLELNKMNPAFRFIRIETPILVRKTLRGESAPRLNMASAAYDAAREFLTTKTGQKYRLPLVIWQHGKVFELKKTQEFYTLEYQILFSKTTGANYFPIVVRSCETMLRKQCGGVVRTDETTGVSFFSDDFELATVKESEFWGGKSIGIVFRLDACTIANLQHEFGKIRRSPPLDKK